MVFSVLCITSQVEHTKKCNSIDSESKFVKQYANHQNHLTVCLYMLFYILGKCFWLEQSALIKSTDWPSMHDCPNQLEESNNYSASVLPKHLLKHEFYRRKACQKSNAICIMAIMSSTLWRPLCPCFLIVPHCIGLK